ncbi:MAG: prolipoprotein diacylglyceryl transferase [Myxococcota bacterium]
MYPILLEIGGIKLPSYAVLMALGYLVALFTIRLIVPPRASSTVPAFHRTQAFDLFIVMLVASLVGAKWGHVLFEAPGHIGRDGQMINSVYELLRDDPWHWLRLDDPGYVWYGGMLGGLVVAVFYFRARPKLDPWLYSDAFTPAIMTGAAVGRLGCFLGGCCYGVPTEMPWGFVFPGMTYAVHPTQLYDAAIAAVLGFGLLYRFPRRRFDGESIAILLMAYPVLRALTESVRGDPERGFLGPLSTSQLISIPLFLIGLGLYVSRTRTAGPATVPATRPMASAEPPSQAPAPS